MTKLSSDRAAAIDPANKYRPIDASTPTGVAMLLINRDMGVAQIGKLPMGRGFFTHWAPLPTFPKET